jgi:hypothetical protein
VCGAGVVHEIGRTVPHLAREIRQRDSASSSFRGARAKPIRLDRQNRQPTGRDTIASVQRILAVYDQRELIVERTVAGIEAARKRGVQLGRRPRVFRRDEVQRLRAEGKSWKAISTALGVPVGTCRGAV